jgi:hydrogenase maturation protein HypF
MITVRGQVQGVGFRPTVWRIATELGLAGDVRNTGEGVEIRLFGGDLDRFAERLALEAPALARVDLVLRAPIEGPSPEGFAIAPSVGGAMRVSVTPDAAACPDCLQEIRDPFARRYRYPFANCTNCGPRFSIIEGAPYDRARTTMRAFALCSECRAEYEAPVDRRFHAQPIACHACGPRAWIERLGAGAVHHEAFSMMDDVDAAGGMVMNGHIVAVKGIGGFHLACDATKDETVRRLRARKMRRSKAFALMARDVEIVRRFCAVSPQEEALLRSSAAPIVILKTAGEKLPDSVAPGLDRLGFMLPYTPMHHLMLRRVTRPVVMTSGNISGQPQCVDNGDARARLAGVADFALMHDRAIANRIDDSVVRVDLGRPRAIRRARGYAPAPIPLPEGFDKNLQALAMGAELKNAFCLVKNGEAILSQHMGDLEDAATDAEAAHNLALYRALYDHAPQLVAVDAHPDYRSTQRGRAMADEAGLPLVEVQHHHAHVAACMAENGWPLGGAPVLGIALDGSGFGADGTIWGGEFLACTYSGFQRLGCFKPVALPGGAQAVREPWRNAYAHLMAEMGWAEFAMNFEGLDLFAKMSALPRQTLDAMIAKGVNAPLSSSCGRLFDAAAAICGLAWDRQDHEGQAAMAFEAAIDARALNEPDDLAYPFSIPLIGGRGIPYVEPLAAWRALLGDLHLATPVGTIAARFHRGLARVIVAMADKISGQDRRFAQIALTGGCFQNATLFSLVHEGLEARGFGVLSHEKTPANDGGLALGQAAIALAHHQTRGD